MKIRFTAQTGFNFVSVCMKLLGIFPVTKDDKFSMISFYLWWFYLINSLICFFLIIYTIISKFDNVLTSTWSFIEMIEVVESIVILINFKFQETRFKDLFIVVENYINNRVLHKRLNNANIYIILISAMVFLYIAIVYMYINKSGLHSKGRLFMTTLYPFSVDFIAVKILVYINQTFFMVHTAAIIVLDGSAVFIMYICAARSEILVNNWKDIDDLSIMFHQINEHQYILRLMNDINKIVSVIVIKTVVSFICCSIGCGIQLFHQDRTVSHMVLPFSILIIVYLRIYICAESAENLQDIGDKLQFTMYSSLWYQDNRKTVMTKLTVIHRCQNMRIIKINGFMSAFNRSYLLKILFTTLSYFTTIHAILTKSK